MSHFKLRPGLTPLNSLVLWPLALDLNSTTSVFEPPVCWWQIVRPFSLHNCASQSLIIDLFLSVSIYPIGSASPETLTNKGTINKPRQIYLAQSTEGGPGMTGFPVLLTILVGSAWLKPTYKTRWTERSCFSEMRPHTLCLWLWGLRVWTLPDETRDAFVSFWFVCPSWG